MKDILVTKPLSPDPDILNGLINRIIKNGIYSNNGPILKQFEKEIKDLLKVDNFQFVSSGTSALQLSISTIAGEKEEPEIITTPFSYVATSSAILWQSVKPRFVDIDTETLCIDPAKVSAAINNNTVGIVAVHTFGNPCDIEKLQEVARSHSLSLIFDAAHAFGVEYKNKSVFSYGDISIASFHSTKVFHTSEGGGVFTNNEDLSRIIDLKKRLGHHGDEHLILGTNAKNSEIHAAVGISNIPGFASSLDKRSTIFSAYAKEASKKFTLQRINPDCTKYNYAYFPIILASERDCLEFIQFANTNHIYPRRYFYPSINKIPYVKGEDCPISEDISKRILCLPIYPSMNKLDITRVINLIKNFHVK